MRTPAPAPMPILVARLGPLSGASVVVGNGGATGSLAEEAIGATREVVRVELGELVKDVEDTASGRVAVMKSELTEVVDCGEPELDATDVVASGGEDIDMGQDQGTMDCQGK